MIFETINQPDVSVGELITIQYFNGREIGKISGVISKIDKKYVWIKETKESEKELRFNLKLDQMIKMN